MHKRDRYCDLATTAARTAALMYHNNVIHASRLDSPQQSTRPLLYSLFGSALPSRRKGLDTQGGHDPITKYDSESDTTSESERPSVFR